MNGYNNISDVGFTPPYAQYVSACMRRYAKCIMRCKMPKFSGDVDRMNWDACARAFDESEYSNILMTVYSEPGSIAENVSKASVEFSISHTIIWADLRRAEKSVAKERGLID